MKKITLVFSLLFVTISFAQTGIIKLEINGIKNAKGNIAVALYNNNKDFTKKEFKSKKIKTKKGKVYAYFKELPKGTYGIAVLHDENKNDKMDYNFMGIPKESYGFSNNPTILMSAPKFNDVAFKLNNGETKNIKIKLN